MMKPVACLLPLALLAACGGAEPEPPADPVQVERLLAQLESENASAEPVAAGAVLPDKAEEKLVKADRMVGSLEKLTPERIDPEVAEALISR